MTSFKNHDSARPDSDPAGGARQAWLISKLEREVAELRAANKILKDIASYLALSEHPSGPLPQRHGRGRGSRPLAVGDGHETTVPDPGPDDEAAHR